MRHRAVLFDLWGTLAHPFPEAHCEEALQAMAQAVGVSEEIFSHCWSYKTWQQRATGFFPTVEANVEYVCQSNGIFPSPEQVAEATRIRLAFTRRALRPREEAIPALQSLQAAGIRRSLLSDCSAEIPDVWLETSLARWIEAPVFSCRTGTKKPDPALYCLACAGLSVSLSECVYVADGYSRELEAARALGMDAVLLAPPEEIAFHTSEWEGATWTGLRITSLMEVRHLVDP